MEKITFKELIQKLKDSGLSVSDFAYGEGHYLDEFSEASLEAQKVKDEWLKNNPNPGYSSTEYQEWLKQHQSLPSKYDIADKEWKEKNNLPDWKEVEQQGGCDEGSNWYSVKYFPTLDMHVKVSGWYQSYHGTDFSDWDDAVTEVLPKEKTITVYESVK